METEELESLPILTSYKRNLCSALQLLRLGELLKGPARLIVMSSNGKGTSTESVTTMRRPSTFEASPVLKCREPAGAPPGGTRPLQAAEG